MALYPPIIESSMPAFDITGSVKIYFSVPSYNNINDISNIHLTLHYQSSNINALSTTDYEDIKIFSFNTYDQFEDGTRRYYVTLNPNNIKDGWTENTLYKVQIRFSDGAAISPDSLSHFSEWSTVCLIKPIRVPTVEITNIENSYVHNQFADFTILYNGLNNSLQMLDQWKIQLLQGNNLLASSGWQQVSLYNYTTNTLALNLFYSLPYEYETGITYSAKVYIKTKNNYQATLTNTFQYTNSYNASFANGTTVKTFISEEQGYIKVLINTKNQSGKLVLRRSSSKDNFLKWQDLKFISFSANQEYPYYDFTAESGIAYKYAIQKVNNSGQRGTPLKDVAGQAGKATIAEWQHGFLLESAGRGQIDKVKQLKLKFDLQLSSFNINIAQSKTDTLGGKYPFIRRNGNLYYRSFPISGTISASMDDKQLFISKDTINNGYSDLYDSFNTNINYYTTQYDFTYQRKFRQAVEQFLYNVKPKLYKSMQEGNIIIKLMDISLSPKQQLNRLIYTFSATAYEIDQPTIKNYIKYGIIETGGN